MLTKSMIYAPIFLTISKS